MVRTGGLSDPIVQRTLTSLASQLKPVFTGMAAEAFPTTVYHVALLSSYLHDPRCNLSSCPHRAVLSAMSSRELNLAITACGLDRLAYSDSRNAVKIVHPRRPCRTKPRTPITGKTPDVVISLGKVGRHRGSGGKVC